MVRQKMQRCLECDAYSLRLICLVCGGASQAAGPLKWSPEDPRSTVRRKMQKVGHPEWVESLPSIDEEE